MVKVVGDERVGAVRAHRHARRVIELRAVPGPVHQAARAGAGHRDDLTLLQRLLEYEKGGMWVGNHEGRATRGGPRVNKRIE